MNTVVGNFRPSAVKLTSGSRYKRLDLNPRPKKKPWHAKASKKSQDKQTTWRAVPIEFSSRQIESLIQNYYNQFPDTGSWWARLSSSFYASMRRTFGDRQEAEVLTEKADGVRILVEVVSSLAGSRTRNRYSKMSAIPARCTFTRNLGARPCPFWDCPAHSLES